MPVAVASHTASTLDRVAEPALVALPVARGDRSAITAADPVEELAPAAVARQMASIAVAVADPVELAVADADPVRRYPAAVDPVLELAPLSVAEMTRPATAAPVETEEPEADVSQTASIAVALRAPLELEAPEAELVSRAEVVSCPAELAAPEAVTSQRASSAVTLTAPEALEDADPRRSSRAVRSTAPLEELVPQPAASQRASMTVADAEAVLALPPVAVALCTATVMPAPVELDSATADGRRVSDAAVDPVAVDDAVAVTDQTASMGVAVTAPALELEADAVTVRRAVRRPLPVEVEDPVLDAVYVVEKVAASAYVA